MATISTGNYTIGGCDLYFSSTIGLTTLASPTAFDTAAHSLGNIVVGEIAPEISYIEHWISVNGRRVKDKTVNNTEAINISFTFDELNKANLNKFFMGTESASVITVLNNTLDEGCAVLKVTTAIGNDIRYTIPKCTLKPDGGWSMNTESWHEIPCMIEVLKYTSGDSTNGTDNTAYLAAPYGKVTLSS